MIDLILKPHGTYQYQWERDERGWDEIQTALGDFANFNPGDDESSLSFWGDSREITITILMKTDTRGAVSIPRELTEAALNIRVREGEESWLAYKTMSITTCRSRWDETFAKIVLTYR